MSQPTPEIRSIKNYHHKAFGRRRQADELRDSGVLSSVYSHTETQTETVQILFKSFWHID